MSSYYNIDDILMEEELLSVVFQVGANGVGLLDPSSEKITLKKVLKWIFHSGLLMSYA